MSSPISIATRSHPVRVTTPSVLEPLRASVSNCPLFLDGWLEFNHLKWGFRPQFFRNAPGGSDAAVLEAVLYLNKRGRVVLPNTNPFLPVVFRPTPARNPVRLQRQWLDLAQPLVQEMSERRLGNTIMLPTEIPDLRPWKWAGFQVEVKYTFYNHFPLDMSLVDSEVRRKCQRAEAGNYTCEKSSNMTHALDCLHETEKRQGFSNGWSLTDLQNLRRLLGDEHFRVYICYGPKGEPASARLILHCPGGRAIDWAAGTAIEHVRSGATQLLIKHIMEDLQVAGATGFDFGGADISSVAAAKMNWGGELVAHCILRDYTVRSLARWISSAAIRHHLKRRQMPSPH